MYRNMEYWLSFCLFSYLAIVLSVFLFRASGYSGIWYLQTFFNCALIWMTLLKQVFSENYKLEGAFVSNQDCT
jgi:hypothetical protein